MSVSCGCPWATARHLFEAEHESLQPLASPKSEVSTGALRAEQRLPFNLQVPNMRYLSKAPPEQNPRAPFPTPLSFSTACL